MKLKEVEELIKKNKKKKRAKWYEIIVLLLILAFTMAGESLIEWVLLLLK